MCVIHNESMIFFSPYNTDSNNKIFITIFLLSLTHIMVEKVFFLGHIFEIEILMDLHVMRTPELENHIFSIRSVCLCLLSVQLENILQQKHLIWYSRFASDSDTT